MHFNELKIQALRVWGFFASGWPGRLIYSYLCLLFIFRLSGGVPGFVYSRKIYSICQPLHWNPREFAIFRLLNQMYTQVFLCLNTCTKTLQPGVLHSLGLRLLKATCRCCQILREKQASGPMKTSPKQATSPVMVKKKRDIITLCTHTDITLNPYIYCIVSVHLLLFLYVKILFCFSSRTSKQYDIQYNKKRIEEEQAQKTLPIFTSNFTEKQAQSCFNKRTRQLCNMLMF